MPIYPDVNGTATSYCSIRLLVGPGIPLVGVKSINYKDAGEISKVRGMSAVDIGRTRGKVSSEGDIEMLQEEWDELLPKITFAGVVGYMESTWPVSVAYAEPSAPQKTKVDALIGVRFHSAEKSNSEGTDALMVKVSMSIMQIRWNGFYAALRSGLPGLP
jgi:hypothetical protein